MIDLKAKKILTEPDAASVGGYGATWTRVLCASCGGEHFAPARTQIARDTEADEDGTPTIEVSLWCENCDLRTTIVRIHHNLAGEVLVTAQLEPMLFLSGKEI